MSWRDELTEMQSSISMLEDEYCPLGRLAKSVPAPVYSGSWNGEMPGHDGHEVAPPICRRKANEALQKSRDEVRQLSQQLLQVQELERKRIAADLHDGVGQSLSLVKLTMELVVQKLKSGDYQEGMEMLQQVTDQVRRTMTELHCTTACLQPSMLDELGLLPSLTCLLCEFELIWPDSVIEKQIAVTEEQVPAALRLTIFRILQEAMNNIAKHAHADRIRIGLQIDDGVLRLAIADNGQGFEPETVAACHGPAGGFGLQTMKERARCSSGIFEVHTHPGNGTRIVVSWDLAPAALRGAQDAGTKSRQKTPQQDAKPAAQHLFLRNRGFTLLELLVVMVIIGLLASYVGPKYFAQIGKSEVKTARAQIDGLGKALDQFRLDTGHYPTNDEGLAALMTKPANEPRWEGPYLTKDVPVDPWGNPYVYRIPGGHGEYDLLSYGNDGQPGGEGQAADITNW